jgi:hypothetical protein
VGAQDEEAHHLGIVFLQHLADGEEVAQRLRHLLVIDADEAVVHPVIDELAVLIGVHGAFGLGDLVFVVRKLQVLAAAVDVEVLAEQLRTHRRALDVPARASRSPGRFPFHFGRLVVAGMLPQHEVERILLAGHDVDALAGAQVFQRLAGKLAVTVELAHRIADVMAFGDIGVAVLFQGADHVQHLRHILGGTRLGVRAQHAQRAGILVHRGDEAIGELADGLAVLLRRGG